MVVTKGRDCSNTITKPAVAAHTSSGKTPGSEASEVDLQLQPGEGNNKHQVNSLAVWLTIMPDMIACKL